MSEMSQNRKSWDEYFCDIAKAVAARSTCKRLSVGCVIVRDKTIIATGYNGSINGAPHCLDRGCVIENDHCIAAVHAEQNAIAQAAKNGTSLAYAIAYVTVNPCPNCFKLLYQAGIKRIVYVNDIPEHLYKKVDYNIFKLNNNQMPDMVCLSDRQVSPLVDEPIIIKHGPESDTTDYQYVGPSDEIERQRPNTIGASQEDFGRGQEATSRR